MTGHNAERVLNFSGSLVSATLVEQVAGYQIQGRAIVVNPTLDTVHVDQEPRKGIPPLSSTVLIDVAVVEADRLIVLRVADGADGVDGTTAAVVDEPGWQHYADIAAQQGSAFPAGTALWRSAVDELGTTHFDAAAVLGGGDTGSAKDTYQVRANLWFAPAGTDCAIHNLHDFIEVHAQVIGRGRMQKFREDDHATLYEDLLMSPGYTTPDPFCLPRPDGTFHYPWHQYYADTPAVWLAVEYHPAAAGSAPTDM